MVKMDMAPDNEEPPTSTSFPSEFILVDFDSTVEQAQEGKFDSWKAEIVGKEKVKFDFFFLTSCIVHQNSLWRWTIALKFLSWCTTGPYQKIIVSIRNVCKLFDMPIFQKC